MAYSRLACSFIYISITFLRLTVIDMTAVRISNMATFTGLKATEPNITA